MRRPLAIVLALLVPAALLAACSDEDGDAGSDGGSTASSELQGRLLDLQDLGDGWTDDPSLEADGANGPECLADPPDPTYQEQVQAGFTVAETGFPSLREKVSEYADEGAVTEAMETAVEAVDACGEFSYTADEIQFTGTVERIELDEVGDESAAWRMSLSAQGFTFEALVLYAREGTHGLSLFYIDLDATDAEAFGSIVEDAVAKAF